MKYHVELGRGTIYQQPVQSPAVTQMAMFVHLTTESRVPRIRRNGSARWREASGTSPEGIYAMPVTRNFYASHQWLRELKRRNQGPIAGVYFRVPSMGGPLWARSSSCYRCPGNSRGCEGGRSVGLGSCSTSSYRGKRNSQNPPIGSSDRLEILPQSEGQAAVLHLQVLYSRRVSQRKAATAAPVT